MNVEALGRAAYGEQGGGLCGVAHRTGLRLCAMMLIGTFAALFPGDPMNLHLSLTPLISLLAGILILIAPRLLNYIVAIYLILIGLVGLFGNGSLHL